MPAKPLHKQANAGRFKPGASGNPAGRKPGTRAKATILGERILQADADAIIRGIVEAAKGGDPTAMKICADRLMPLRRGKPVAFALPPSLETPDDLNSAFNAVLGAISRAELSPEEGGSIATIIEMRRRTLELAELADIRRRLAEVEDQKP